MAWGLADDNPRSWGLQDLMPDLQPGNMRTLVEYGRMDHVFNDEGGVNRSFTKLGEFWAEKRATGGSEKGSIVTTVAGVDISDDVATLRTWAGHELKTEYVLRIKGNDYSILSLLEWDNGRIVELKVVSGLRDKRG